MTNLYLLQSKCESNDSGDVIINLDEFKTMGSAKISENRYRIFISLNNEDNLVADFDKKEDAIFVLKEIISNLGGDMSLVERFNFSDISKDEQERKNKLKKLVDLI